MFPVNHCNHNNYYYLYKLSTEGRLSGGINQEGIKYYNNLINELIVNGIHISSF